MAVTGLATSFAPVEVLTFLKISPTEPLPVIMQILGALYTGFALANWTAKDSLIGGIYARPLALGNLVHFTVATLALFKYEMKIGFQGMLIVLLVAYAMLALAFSWLIFARGTACKVSQG